MIHQMETSHLVFSAKKILREHWRTVYFHFIRDELIYRNCNEIELEIGDAVHDIFDNVISIFDIWRGRAEQAIDIHMETFHPYPEGPDDNSDDIEFLSTLKVNPLPSSGRK